MCKFQILGAENIRQRMEEKSIVVERNVGGRASGMWVCNRKCELQIWGVRIEGSGVWAWENSYFFTAVFSRPNATCCLTQIRIYTASKGRYRLRVDFSKY